MEVDNEIEMEFLRNKRTELRDQVVCLQHQESELRSLISKVYLALTKAKCDYQMTDFRLACLDGRMTICEEITQEAKIKENIKTITSMLSAEQRSQLLAELEGLDE